MNIELDYLRAVIGSGHAERAWERGEKVDASLKKNQQRLKTLEERIRKTPGAGKRILWLRQATEVLAEATRGNVSCHDGCSACCNMTTIITLEEAKLIAKETGAALTVPASYTDLPESHFQGEPCTFLQEGRCGIYSSRPVPCRVHFSFADDATLCAVEKGVPMKSPNFRPDFFNKLYTAAHMKKGFTVDDFNLADIRTFFPKGLNK